MDWKVSNIFPVINNMFIKTNICCRRYKIVVEVENVEIMSGSEVLHGFALFLIALARVIHYTNLFYGHMQWHQYFLIIYNYIGTNDFLSITSAVIYWAMVLQKFAVMFLFRQCAQSSSIEYFEIHQQRPYFELKARQKNL